MVYEGSTRHPYERVAGVERSEPPGPRLSGGSLALDPGHPKLAPAALVYWVLTFWNYCGSITPVVNARQGAAVK